MFKGKISKNLIATVLLSVGFGMLGGITGEIIAKAYFADNSFGIPFLGAIDITREMNGLPNVVIRDAKKVVVEQDDKTKETVDSAGRVLVGIFKRKTSGTEKDMINTAAEASIYYQLDQQVGQGLIVTSDGWVMTGFNFADSQTKIKSELKDTIKDYVIITNDNKVNSIDKIVNDPIFPIYYIHIAEKNLPVVKLAPREDLNIGQTLIAVGWRQKNSTSRLSVFSNTVKSPAVSSDIPAKELLLQNKLDDGFKGSFLFNQGGDAVGIVGSDLKNLPLFYFSPTIQSILTSGKVSRPSLGLKYLNLSDFAFSSTTASQYESPVSGDLIVQIDNKNLNMTQDPNTILKKGDIVVSLDNKEITGKSGLAEILTDYQAGSELDAVVKRNGNSLNVTIKVGEFKK